MYYEKTDFELRSDSDFRDRKQPQHHKITSLLEKRPIDMIKSFPISDPIHLMELGIMKRFTDI